MQIGMECKDSLTAHAGSTKEGVQPCPRTGRGQSKTGRLVQCKSAGARRYQ